MDIQQYVTYKSADLGTYFCNDEALRIYNLFKDDTSSIASKEGIVEGYRQWVMALKQENAAINMLLQQQRKVSDAILSQYAILEFSSAKFIKKSLCKYIKIMVCDIITHSNISQYLADTLISYYSRHLDGSLAFLLVELPFVGRDGSGKLRLEGKEYWDKMSKEALEEVNNEYSTNED